MPYLDYDDLVYGEKGSNTLMNSFQVLQNISLNGLVHFECPNIYAKDAHSYNTSSESF